MHFNCIETGLNADSCGISKRLGYILDILFSHFPVKGRRIQVEAVAGSYRHAVAGAPVSHIATVAKLDAGFCPFRVDCIRKFLQVRDNFLAEQKLTIEGQAAFAYGSIGYCRHSDAASCHSCMVVK